ncbi:MAG TPA: hypothetical protein VMV52_08770 [Candidatus Nanopelagicaceae bacterium]|nr:hypothetical protein [Candidatus Nanopelagicaceae bacterium]
MVGISNALLKLSPTFPNEQTPEAVGTYAWIARGGITHDLVFAPASQMFDTREITVVEDFEARTAHLDAEKKVA